MSEPHDEGTLLDYIHTLLKNNQPNNMTMLTMDGAGDDAEIMVGISSGGAYSEFVVSVQQTLG